MKDVLRREHYAYATEQSYVAWVRCDVAFHGWRKPSTLEAEHVHAFLKQLVKKYLSLYCPLGIITPPRCRAPPRPLR